MNNTPLLKALGAATVVAAVVAFALPARADIGDPRVRCYDSDAANTSYNPSYVNCAAFYNDTPAPQTTLIDPFAGYGNFNFVGQTKNDDSGSGPFEAFGTGFKFGTLTLDLPQKGTFVIALASFNDYSLYLFDASQIVDGVLNIEFSTYGTTNAFGGPYQLEYANLYAPVPEPSSIALMLAGLAATGLALRRRRR